MGTSHLPSKMGFYGRFGETALRETSTSEAFVCVPADHKPTMRLLVAQKIHETLREMNPAFQASTVRPLQNSSDRARLLSMDND